jgi:VWFA-related protein
MKAIRLFTPFLLLSAVVVPCLSVAIIHAQQPAPKQSPRADEIVRVSTELVQTDLTVVDKRGNFVPGLRPEQFELTLDGKSQTISFFEQVSAGSAKEARQLVTARGGPANTGTGMSFAEDKGRVIFFFLDDVHLSGASLIRARKALTEFIDNQMKENDQVAIVSTSGQVGFLQQLTDYRPMLHAAVERLYYKKNPETYAGKVPITDYEASQVADNNDRELFLYLVTATMNEYQAKGALRRVAMNMVQNRVRQISAQTRMVTTDLLEVLESLMRSSAGLPGRKLVFFISDGFITNVRGSNALVLLKRVTDLAAQSGVVVYTMDARGTITDPLVDAGRNDFPDGMASGTQARHPSLENVAMQEPLHLLADDTGGRAIIGSNSFADAFQQAVDETSNYYLLAWRPANDEQRTGKSRIKVTVKDRSDLRVRLRRNYYVPPAAVARETKSGEPNQAAPPVVQSPEAGLLQALGTLYPRQVLRTSLAVGYMNTLDQGLVLKAAMQIDRAALDLSATGPQKSEVDVVGAAIDDRGTIVTFKQLLTVTFDPAAEKQSPNVVWNQQLRVPPGLYQVRVAVRERSSGLTGSARQWIEVPDVSGGKLQISSLFLGERRNAATGDKTNIPQAVLIDVDQHFARSSVLRYQTYVYNAAKDTLPADVEIQTSVLRDHRPVVTMPAAKLPTDTTKDRGRFPYWAEISLNQLPPGRYALQVTAIDRATKSTASQTASFVIE